MFKSNQLDYINPEDVSIRYNIPHFETSLYSFKYCDVPLFGCGNAGTPIINCDDYYDTELLNGLEEEFDNNIEHAKQRLHYMMPFGLVPSDLNNQKCLDSHLLNLDKYDPELTYKDYIKNITHYHELKNYMANRFNLNKPWKNVIHLKRLKSFFEKNQTAEWNEVAQHFPKLVKLVESLPFKSIGYVMVMRNNENRGLDIHRDIFPRNHNCHHINIAIDKKPRQVFMYDSLTNTKYYKDPESYSYFFNECDLHGADRTFSERLTLRVDGEFEDWFSAKIGLENGITFDWAYDKPQDFYKSNGSIPIIQETDI